MTIFVMVVALFAGPTHAMAPPPTQSAATALVAHLAQAPAPVPDPSTTTTTMVPVTETTSCVATYDETEVDPITGLTSTQPRWYAGDCLTAGALAAEFDGSVTEQTNPMEGP